MVKGVSESLAGRNAYLELAPLHLLEIIGKADLSKHSLRGGFPSALLSRSQGVAHEWLQAFTRSYIERDLSILFGVEFTPNLTRRLLSMLAHVHGQVWNAEMIARSLGVSAPTVNRYVDYLEGAYLIHRVPAFSFNTRKRLVRSPKVYIRDSGMLLQIAGVRDMTALLGHPIAGLSWEGYVIEQIYQVLPGDLMLYFYRTQAGAECDVILVRGIRPIACIEIKLSNAPALSRGYYQCIDDLKTTKNFVLVPEVDSYRTKEEVWVGNLMDFLKNHLRKL